MRVCRRRFLKYAGAGVAAAVAATAAHRIYEAAKPLPATTARLTATSTAASSITTSVYPEPLLKAPSDLKRILFVAVHPFNRFEEQRTRWDDVFSAYHIQFLDRATAFNDNYMTGVDRDTVSLAHSLNVFVASFKVQNPQEHGDWSFRRQYYDLLPASDRWTDAEGRPQDDPYTSSGGRDINGSLITWGPEYVMMSISSPFWADYHKRSIEYAVDNGIDAIDMDGPSAVPSAVSATGDFSDWSLKAFNRYLREHYDAELLRSWGIEDILGFDFKEYLLRRYISEQKLTAGAKQLGFLILVLFVLWEIVTYIPSIADSYVRLLPENIAGKNADALLAALVQVEGTLLGFFGLIFVAILTIIQSHIELARRELDRHPDLPDDSPERSRLTNLFTARSYVIFLMAASVLFLVVSVFLTLSTLAWVGTELPRFSLQGIITALLFGIFLVFVAIWLALRVRG